MSIDVKYCDTLLSALSNSYTSGDYVRTFGFASVGDGGAAVYKVVSGVPSDAISCAVSGASFNYGYGKFYSSGDIVFQLIPQHGKVYAEQFGVFPDNIAFAAGNITMLNKAVTYAAQNGCVLTFASSGVYYLNRGSIYIQSGMYIDGNGATLQICDTNNKEVNLFDMGSSSDSPVDNVTIKNITLIGRRIAADEGSSDQGIHIKGTNLNVKNVSFKYFFIAIHTYGGDEVQYDTDTDTETETDTDTENKTYIIVDIPNKNWLIDSCKTESCVFGIITSEIDGLVIKDSDISCYTTSKDTAHCVYLSSNCSNVRVTGCSLHDVSGDAIHKVYPYSEKLDLSKNHFYTDLSIHYADSALDIDFISQNVMCDNVFATEVAIALELSAADNCIVSNSYFSQTRATGDMKAFIYAKKACNCWLQNSYVYYEGQHRVTYEYQESNMLSTVFEDKKHRRMFVGPIFDIPNHWFKFTGCELVADKKECYYFDKSYDAPKTVFNEYWDNCMLIYSKQKDFFRLRCINSLPAGITIRNSYLKDTFAETVYAPFRFQCGQANCNCLTENTCSKKQLGKRFPFVHYENNILDRFYYSRADTFWGYHISTFQADAHQFTIPEAVAISGSYVSGVYRLRDGIFSKMKDLDKSGQK